MVVTRARQARTLLLSTGLIAVFVLVSCSGPDEFGGASTTPVSTSVPSPTATEDTEIQATPTGSMTSSPTVEADSTPTPTDAEPSPTAEPTQEPEPTPTEEPEPIPTTQAISAMDALPRLEELTEAGYLVADQGDRTAEQLAQAYSDTTAHLVRLDEWGFQQHVFREFSRNETGPDDPLPTYVLATVNVYGSSEQADLALQWLGRFQTNQGQTAVDAPDLGDAAIALTVTTAQGEPSASLYIRLDARVYIYYAQGNEPLPEVVAIAERVFGRLTDQGRVAWKGWSS
jgi:hypothetical protein